MNAPNYAKLKLFMEDLLAEGLNSPATYRFCQCAFESHIYKLHKEAKKMGSSSRKPMKMVWEQIFFEESFEKQRTRYKNLVMTRMIVGLLILVLTRSLVRVDNFIDSRWNAVFVILGCLLLIGISYVLLTRTPQSWFLESDKKITQMGRDWLAYSFGSAPISANFRRKCRSAGLACQEHELFQSEQYRILSNRQVNEKLESAVAFLPMWECISLGVSSALAFFPLFTQYV